MNEEIRKISFIDGKITELEAEKGKIEKDLTSCRQRLGDILVAESLGENSGSEIPGLRKEITSHEQRINEIDSTIAGLKARRNQEDIRYKANEADKIKRALKQIDLEYYRAYREELIHNKAMVTLRNTYADLRLKREQECTKLSAIGVNPGLNFFIVSEKWYENKDDMKKQRIFGGLMPWQDIDSDDGMKFINEEIARLESEVGK